MKKQLLLLFVMLAFFSCSKDVEITKADTAGDIISFEDLKEDVENTLRAGDIYDWEKKSDLLWKFCFALLG